MEGYSHPQHHHHIALVKKTKATSASCSACLLVLEISTYYECRLTSGQLNCRTDLPAGEHSVETFWTPGISEYFPQKSTYLVRLRQLSRTTVFVVGDPLYRLKLKL
jgi:hypothetical protein